MRQIKKMQARGIYDPEKEDPFDLFISSTNIRWCYYKETQRILGSTYGECPPLAAHPRQRVRRDARPQGARHVARADCCCASV